MPELFNALGRLLGNVDPNLSHHPDRQRVDLRRIRARTEDLVFVSKQVPQQAFSHLRPGGIVFAEKQNAFLIQGPTLPDAPVEIADGS